MKKMIAFACAAAALLIAAAFLLHKPEQADARGSQLVQNRGRVRKQQPRRRNCGHSFSRHRM